MTDKELRAIEEYWKLVGAADHCDRVAMSIEDALAAGIGWQDLGPEDSIRHLRLVADGYRGQARISEGRKVLKLRQPAPGTGEMVKDDLRDYLAELIDRFWRNRETLMGRIEKRLEQVEQMEVSRAADALEVGKVVGTKYGQAYELLTDVQRFCLHLMQEEDGPKLMDSDHFLENITLDSGKEGQGK